MQLRSIHLHEIPDDGLEFDLVLDRAWLRAAFDGTGYAPDDTAAGRARVRLDKHGKEVTLTGDATARVMGECVRCLAAVKLPIEAHFVLYLEPRSAGDSHAHKDDVELSAQELDADYYDGDVIEIGPWVREQLLLEAPNHPTCPAGCAEPIEPPAVDVREQRTVDPRLAPLMKFAKKME